MILANKYATFFVANSIFFQGVWGCETLVSYYVVQIRRKDNNFVQYIRTNQ